MRGYWFWTNLSSGNFVYFCKSDVSVVQGHPRSLILVPIESAYRVCDFLLVRKSNLGLGPILHHFGDMTTFMCSWPHGPHLYSTVILGVFPLHQIAHVGVSQRVSLKLFGREIIFEEFQPMRARYRYLKRHRQTDRRYCGNTALCIASRATRREKKSL